MALVNERDPRGMSIEWATNLAILALLTVGAALIVLRGHSKGRVRRISAEERDFLRERGINPRFGSFRKLSDEDRRAFEARRTSSTEY